MDIQIGYETRLQEGHNKHMALYLSLRDGIASGLLPPGERLPSTRRLAELYGLSRGSVCLAYDMLAAEGYVTSGVGQGTFVAGAGTKRPGSEGAAAPPAACAEPAPLSAWARRVLQMDEAREEEAAGLSFQPAGIGTALFPWREWRSAVNAEWKRLGPAGPAAEPAATQGSVELRRAIARRLRRERGIDCAPEDVVVTGGSMQAIALLAQLLLEPGLTAVVEDPCYDGIRRAVAAAGAAYRLAPVDGQGIVPDDWAAQALFVTPSRQFPTGAALGYDRRLALLDWASRRGAWIIEDDYDSEFRWGGRPIEPLKSLDREGRVVYVGTFSRLMRAEVRIGYAVVPPALRGPLAAAKRLYDPYPAGVAEQRALARWMSDGGFERHIRRTRRILGRLVEHMREELLNPLAGLFRVWPSDAGLHVYAQWRGAPGDYERLLAACRSRGVTWGAGGRYDGGESAPPSAIFGFAHLDETQIREGAARIRETAARLFGRTF